MSPSRHAGSRVQASSLDTEVHQAHVTTSSQRESHEVEEQRPVNSIAHTTRLTLHTVVFVDKLPHNIIRCKAYGIPNAQNKTCEMLNGS